MKKRVLKYLPAALIALFILTALYFVYPFAPLLLLISAAIQLPIIWCITKSAMAKAYQSRAQERYKQFLRGGDAAAWLLAEESESAGAGYRYWPAGAKAQNTISRADALTHLGKMEEAAAILASVNPHRLPKAGRARFCELLQSISHL